MMHGEVKHHLRCPVHNFFSVIILKYVPTVIWMTQKGLPVWDGEAEGLFDWIFEINPL